MLRAWRASPKAAAKVPAALCQPLISGFSWQSGCGFPDRMPAMQSLMAQYSYRDDPLVPAFDDSTPIAVMDAECALCSWGARMIHRLDRSGTVRICPIQSALGSALLRHYGLVGEDPASWLFIEDGMAYADFDAVAQAGRRFGGIASLARGLMLFPGPARAWLYQRVARNRYALFGRADLCALPDPAFQRRLLR